ncbi:MAG: thymidylate kinase [Patescibacteria group bacterium]
MLNKGKFIALEGSDGSGKATQTKLLANKLKKLGHKVATIDFPQYGKKSAGLVEEYLNGKYGTSNDVGPYRASVFYAVDRYDASFKIKKWLGEGKIVIADRYSASNMAHQGGKIKDLKERFSFFNWVLDLEYNIFKIPKPDLNIILHVPASISQKLVDKKGFRKYINGAKRDLHEKDINHLKQAEIVYQEIAKKFNNITLLKCVKDNNILSRQTIHEMTWKKIKKIL